MLHARFIPHLRPLVSRFISDVRNLFRKCDRYYPDEEATHSAVPYFHRFRNDPPWKESELPPFGSLITVVPAKSQRKNEAKLNLEAMPCFSAASTLSMQLMTAAS